MAVAVAAPPALSGELALYHTTDPLLANSPVLIFYGTAATIGATSSRIQVHVFTPAGHESYLRLAVSPNSPLYSAVANLPREEQGDEVCRGIAFGLKKYFAELSQDVKQAWCAVTKTPAPQALFGDDHVAILASRMARVENVDELVGEIKQAFAEHIISWLDVDVVLPPGSIKQPLDGSPQVGSDDLGQSQLLAQRLGKYADLVHALGDDVFLPTSKLKRAPSKVSSAGKPASFSRRQKENVRKELHEMVVTEENYVRRLQQLVDLFNSAAAEDGDALSSIFPASLVEILSLNQTFLLQLREIFDSTEQAALQNISFMLDDQPTAQQALQDFKGDTQGIEAVSQYLCGELPHFRTEYRKYMSEHGKCAQTLRTMLRQSESDLPLAIRETGEQKLTSLLIEPVQRLPRYSLYIDTIVKQLPARHPAVKHLLKARDIVAEICDADGDDDASVLRRLKSRIAEWPKDQSIHGRLVTIVDVIEILPPYTLEGCTGDHGMLLLFTDGIVFVTKRGRSVTSAKHLMTEIESGLPPVHSAQSRPYTPSELQFLWHRELDSLDFLEGHGGQTVHMIPRVARSDCTARDEILSTTTWQTFKLESSYERKAERLSEEIVKARIEGRFSEAEREGSKWELRVSDPAAETASLFWAIFEDSITDHVRARRSVAPTRVIVDIDRHAVRPRAGSNGIRTVICLSPLRDGQWRLSVESLDGRISREQGTIFEVVSALPRKLTALVGTRFSISQGAMTERMLAQNRDILQSFDVHISGQDDASELPEVRRERTHRSKSPRKFLSSFLPSTGTTGHHSLASIKKDLPPLPPPTISRSLHGSQISQKPPSRESRPASRDQPTPRSMSSMRSHEATGNPIKKLEDTLSTYLLALQARKGNIVGRNLKMRASCDELAVNELYNMLLEDANMMVLAAQASVDVLFSAFEKFLNAAWKEQIGQVLPPAMMREIQSKAETLFPTDFDEFFKNCISALPPQNQRAFKGVMELLADLLDGTGNDGDRGVLTAAFAEVLVTEDDPHDYIALIDRFVDDPETYFGEPLEDVQKTAEADYNPNKRARSANSASVSSNASSLRKKFGLSTLMRDSSKSEQESKVASVWRSLSKTARGDASPAGSMSRAALQRSLSTDDYARGSAKRPVSQDGVSAQAAPIAGEPLASATPPSASQGLSTIGEHPSFIPTGPPRKKRRSSLSDIKDIQVSGMASPAWSPPTHLRLPPPHRVEEKSLPNSPGPSTPSSKGGSGRFGSPSRDAARSRLPGSFRKENSPGPIHHEARPKSKSGKSDEVVITARPTSNIPTLTPTVSSTSPRKGSAMSSVRDGLAERAGAGNIVKKPSPKAELKNAWQPAAETSVGASKKLRMQSPQKLRERLQNERSAVAIADNSLMDELGKIGDELNSTLTRAGSIRPGLHARSQSQSTQGGSTGLLQRVQKIEGDLPSQMEELKNRINNIQSDLASSLTVSESKCRKLDELYREANNENEALYGRFNDELSRILKAVKGGNGVEELREKLKESQEEAAKLKRESNRLKRENAGLRAQLR